MGFLELVNGQASSALVFPNEWESPNIAGEAVCVCVCVDVVPQAVSQQQHFSILSIK